MPRRIPDYPDCFYEFNKIASIGSYMSTISLIIFIIILWDIFIPKKVVTTLMLIPFQLYLYFQDAIIISERLTQKFSKFCLINFSIQLNEKKIYIIFFNIHLTINLVVYSTKQSWLHSVRYLYNVYYNVYNFFYKFYIKLKKYKF
jgi:hypothetical protein